MDNSDKESSADFEFANKYINDDSSEVKNKKSMFSDEKFGMGSSTSTEVLGGLGQEEGYSENKRYNEEEDNIDILADKHSEKIEFQDKARVKAIIESDKHTANESITLDTINSVNKDSKRK